MFNSIFGLLVASKKIAGGTAAASIIGVGGYYGIVKPSISSRDVSILDGSRPIMGKKRGDADFWREHDNKNILENIQKTSEEFSNTSILSADHLRADTYKSKLQELPKEIQEIFEKHEITKKTLGEKSNDCYGNDGNDDLKYSADFAIYCDKYFISGKNHTLRSAAHLRRTRWRDSIISDIEFTYKSYKTVKRVNDLTKNQIIFDLMWSLAEDSDHNKTMIKADSISIQLDREEKMKQEVRDDGTVINIDELPARKYKNIKIKFKIKNPNSTVKSIFKIINLEAYSESEVEIKIDDAEIRPYSKPVANHMAKAVSWTFVPKNNSKVQISITQNLPSKQIKKTNIDTIDLLWGRSKMITWLLNNYSDGSMGTVAVGSTNAPTMNLWKDKASEYLANITKDEIKKDIETWYGAYAAHYLRITIKDMVKILRILTEKLVPSGGLKNISILDALTRNANFRNQIYEQLKLDPTIKRVIDPIFDAHSTSEFKITGDELNGWIKSFAYKMNEALEKFKVEFEWLSEPSLSWNREDLDEFPEVSFKFKQTYSWEDDLIIPFKGCWKSNENKYDENYDGCSDGNIKFDLSKKTQFIKSLLTPIHHKLNKKLFNRFNILDVLIPDAQNFIGWEKIKVDKNEKISNTYEAINSPIRLSVLSNPDGFDKLQVVPGWKALDVNQYVDLSNFYRIFASFLEKVAEYNDTNKEKVSDISITNITNKVSKIKQQAKTNPISFIVHLINDIFSKEYSEGKFKSTEENKKPWHVFFKSLFSKTLNLGSQQLFAGYTRSIFNVEDFVLTDTKDTKDVYPTKKDWNKKEVNKKEEITDDRKFVFPALAKNKELGEFFEKLEMNFSTNYPNHPVVFDTYSSNSSKDWIKFLEHEGGTTEGFIRHRDKIKQMMKRDLVDIKTNEGTLHYFPDHLIDWNKVKINTTPLEIGNALRQVLTLKNTINSTLSTLSSFSSLLSGVIPGVKSLDVGNITNFLGEGIARDIMLVSVNFMLESSGFLLVRSGINVTIPISDSINRFFVNMKWDCTKTRLKQLGIC